MANEWPLLPNCLNGPRQEGDETIANGSIVKTRKDRARSIPLGEIDASHPDLWRADNRRITRQSPAFMHRRLLEDV